MRNKGVLDRKPGGKFPPSSMYTERSSRGAISRAASTVSGVSGAVNNDFWAFAGILRSIRALRESFEPLQATQSEED